MARSRQVQRQRTPLMDYIRPAFGSGLGLFGSVIVYMFVAVLFFVPGFVLVKRENAKEKEKQSVAVKAVGYFLMAMGMIIGMGFGAGAFLGELGGEF